jgi:phosphatidate cytidylyltransferase
MTRLISGVALAAAALAAILYLPDFALRVLACVVAGLAAHEFLTMAGLDGGRSNLPIAVVIVCCAVASARFDAHYEVIAGALLALVGLGVLAGDWRLADGTAGAFASLYVGVPLGMLVAIHARHGARATLLIIGAVVVSDSAQYYTGRAFGRRPLAPAISPKKTVEGAVGGVVFGTLFMTFAGTAALPVFGYAVYAALGATIVVFGICGDLFESRLKRSAGMKDSSALIPGHGGVLDRIDALLFAVPAYYGFLRVMAP